MLVRTTLKSRIVLAWVNSIQFLQLNFMSPKNFDLNSNRHKPNKKSRHINIHRKTKCYYYCPNSTNDEKEHCIFCINHILIGKAAEIANDDYFFTRHKWQTLKSILTLVIFFLRTCVKIFPQFWCEEFGRFVRA